MNYYKMTFGYGLHQLLSSKMSIYGVPSVTEDPSEEIWSKNGLSFF